MGQLLSCMGYYYQVKTLFLGRCCRTLVSLILGSSPILLKKKVNCIECLLILFVPLGPKMDLCHTFIFFKPLCPFPLFLTQIFSDRFPRGEKLGSIERWKHTPSLSRRRLSPCTYVLCQIPFPCAWRNLCQILIHQFHRRLDGSESEQWERCHWWQQEGAVQRRRGFLRCSFWPWVGFYQRKNSNCRRSCSAVEMAVEQH